MLFVGRPAGAYNKHTAGAGEYAPFGFLLALAQGLNAPFPPHPNFKGDDSAHEVAPVRAATTTGNTRPTKRSTDGRTRIRQRSLPLLGIAERVECYPT